MPKDVVKMNESYIKIDYKLSIYTPHPLNCHKLVISHCKCVRLCRCVGNNQTCILFAESCVNVMVHYQKAFENPAAIHVLDLVTHRTFSRNVLLSCSVPCLISVGTNLRYCSLVS